MITNESIGIKTLDPINEHYCAEYNNADDSTVLKTSHGYSYHNGPVKNNFYNLFWVFFINFFEFYLKYKIQNKNIITMNK